MAFANQFALSIELTKLLPLRKAANATGEAVLQFARALRGSGSDIVVEEDLAILLGRLTIADNIATSFRNIVAKSGRLEQLTSEITLESGPGPTVSRSLMQNQSAYFSTVIQCSFLLSIHDRTSLASALAYTFARGTSNGISPSSDAIIGVLRACEDQTNAYEWNGQLQAVTRQLEIPEQHQRGPIPAAVFRGSVFVLPMCQTLPRDRRAEVVQGVSGLPAFIVWAHHIGGLSVTVRIYNWKGHHLRTVTFGAEDAEVLVDCQEHCTPQQASITLLDTAENTPLFKFTVDADDPGLDYTPKQPIVDIGLKHLDDAWYACNPTLSSGCPVMMCCLSEAATVCVASALNLGARLHMTSSRGITLKQMVGLQDNEQGLQAPISLCERRLWDAAKLIFGIGTRGLLVDQGEIRKRRTLYAELPIRDIPAPLAIQTAIEQGLSAPELWTQFMLPRMAVLIVLLISLAYVQNLDDLRKPGLRISLQAIESGHHLTSSLWHWNGKTKLNVFCSSWFQTLALGIVGIEVNANQNFGREHALALVSNQNWSVHVATLGESDPMLIDASKIYVKQGVPTRNNIRKHAIVDGTTTFQRTAGNYEIILAPKKIRLHWPVIAHFNVPLCGERGDNFVVSLRVVTEGPAITETRRTGYQELQTAIWMLKKAEPCTHQIFEDTDFQLPPNCQAVAGWLGAPDKVPSAKVTIFLTANNVAARWAALVTSRWYLEDKNMASLIAGTNPPEVEIMLRGHATCLSCAVKQASLLPQCFLIL